MNRWHPWSTLAVGLRTVAEVRARLLEGLAVDGRREEKGTKLPGLLSIPEAASALKLSRNGICA